MICIEACESGQRRRIDNEIWVLRQSNGTVVRCPRPKAQGVSDGAEIWSLGTLEGYPRAKLIPLAEYEEHLAEPDPDPELTAGEALNIILGGSYETE